MLNNFLTIKVGSTYNAYPPALEAETYYRVEMKGYSYEFDKGDDVTPLSLTLTDIEFDRFVRVHDEVCRIVREREWDSVYTEADLKDELFWAAWMIYMIEYGAEVYKDMHTTTAVAEHFLENNKGVWPEWEEAVDELFWDSDEYKMTQIPEQEAREEFERQLYDTHELIHLYVTKTNQEFDIYVLILGVD